MIFYESYDYFAEVISANSLINKVYVSDTKKQNAIMVAGAGLFLYLITMNQTITRSVHFIQKYVPFGIVGISMIGLFAYMINAIDVRNDVN